MKRITVFLFVLAVIFTSCEKFETADMYPQSTVTPTPVPGNGPAITAKVMNTNTTIQNGATYNFSTGLIVFTTSPVDTINWTITPGAYYGQATQIAHYFTAGTYTMTLTKPGSTWTITCTFIIGNVTPPPVVNGLAPVTIKGMNVTGGNVVLDLAVGWKALNPTFSQTAVLQWVKMINGTNWTSGSGVTITTDSCFFTLTFPDVSNSYVDWNISFSGTWLVAGNTPTGASAPSILLTTTAAPNNNYFGVRWVDSTGFPGVKLLKAPNGTTIAKWPGGIINPPSAAPGLWGDNLSLRGEVNSATQDVTLYFNNVAAGGTITARTDSVKTGTILAPAVNYTTTAVTSYPGWSQITVPAGTASVITGTRSLLISYTGASSSPWYESAYGGIVITW